jgi:predicted nucleic acid-binding protein
VKKIRFVADTMALILRLEKRKMGPRAKASFISAEKAEIGLIIPAMVLVELCYLSEKKRIETNLTEFKKYRNKYESIAVEPMTEELIKKAFEINDIHELHDRIIAGTALKVGAKLITNDPIIARSKFVEVIW